MPHILLFMIFFFLKVTFIVLYIYSFQYHFIFKFISYAHDIQMWFYCCQSNKMQKKIIDLHTNDQSYPIVIKFFLSFVLDTLTKNGI